ncbi:MAG TPA: S46 family peptidase, partial [Chiayiivirga sp.]|nr:S46 family peptidase [Chiayiivirga sp.]
MRLPLIFAGLLAAMPALAVEGMWTPEQLPEISEALTRAGLQLDPAALSDLRGQPMGAVVSLGGCTASFVSPRGLVVTNHHCAYGALQLNSTPENHMLRDGFIAASLADEPSAGPAARIWVTEDISDVTGTVLGAISRKATDRQRNDAIEAAQKRLVAECEADGQYRCRVFSHFGGVQYRLFRQMEIRDVRIAYAPPEAIGKFGGDTDNWQWPRHTGDFTFYRAYVGPDGKPAPFSKDNVPYRPRHFLPIAKDGVAEGDFVMVAGYPGRTQRYQLADQIEDAISWSYP